MQPSSLIPGDLPKEIENLSGFRNLHTNIYSSSINAQQILETTQMAFIGQMN